MTRTALITAAAGGSAALLIAALISQYLFGLAPCELCIWQRWPHVAAMAAAPLAWVLAGPVGPGLGGAAALTAGGLGIHHTGVERGWWAGPDACGAPGDIGALSPEALLAQILDAPVVRCDEVVWSFLGLSMASWNALLSFALAGLWGLAVLRSR
ncbi:MAG: disulfide bond formation protein B [Alkalilacustris sp.]